MDPLQDGLADQIFRRDDLFGFEQHLAGDFLGNHQHPILVTDDEVTCSDGYPANPHRVAVAFQLPPPDNVERGPVAAKDREFQLQDVVNVTAATVDDGATGPQELSRLGGKLSQVRRQ